MVVLVEKLLSLFSSDWLIQLLIDERSGQSLEKLGCESCAFFQHGLARVLQCIRFRIVYVSPAFINRGYPLFLVVAHLGNTNISKVYLQELVKVMETKGVILKYFSFFITT